MNDPGANYVLLPDLRIRIRETEQTPVKEPLPFLQKFTLLRRLILISVAVILAVLVHHESQNSNLQARFFSSLGEKLSFHREPGHNAAVRYPQYGPYDQRLGYVSLPTAIQHLQKQRFSVTAQARLSPALTELIDHGLFAVYPEKTQVGLQIRDRNGGVLFSTAYPTLVYPHFDAIPPLVVNTLLFLEDRELLDKFRPQMNPAVEWDRLVYAGFSMASRKLGANVSVPGGSTLATQIEKYRHSPQGRTSSIGEKLRQMASASLRAYLMGPDTRQAQREIVLAYINSMPLAARPHRGEVHGLGDGLSAWYGADFGKVNQLLSAEANNSGKPISRDMAVAYRQVLNLLLGQRRPTYYLGSDYESLQTLTDKYLRILATYGIISPSLRDAALQVSGPRPGGSASSLFGFSAGEKTVNVLRTRLASTLGIESLYELDRLDLTATTTIDQPTQQAVSEALNNLRDPAHARTAGIIGSQLLGEKNDLDQVVYSLILIERGESGNLLRVQADNYPQPLDINEGTRLDLGSTAKLRTTVHYLEIIADLYQRYNNRSPEELGRVNLHPRDHLSTWVIDTLGGNQQMSLPQLVSAALERHYSANPGERFYTGGGLHRFVNFSARDNQKVLSVRNALRNSVNLVFIRLMRDIVYHHMYKPGGVARWLEMADDPRHQEYLARFADQEGGVFLRRFYADYRGKNADEITQLLTQSIRPRPVHLTTLYRSLYPDHKLSALSSYLHAHVADHSLDDEDIAALYEKYSPDRFNLQDRAYITGIHPLKLWLASHVAQYPGASFNDVIAASAKQRQEAYQWLFRTSRQHAKQKRILMLLEREAFAEIHRAWRRLGFPFETMTASYASSIGASGDNPAALAELMGILLNGGVRRPMVRFDALHYAAATPYETLLTLSPTEGKRVLPAEIASVVRDMLIDVVEQGTAKRLKSTFKKPEGNLLIVGGKTGTGDHRRKTFAPGGRLIESQVVSRSATFVFFMGDRFYGTITAYVKGPSAAQYRFTSPLCQDSCRL